MSNRVIWFDLPVIDLKRAMKFYSKVLEAEVREDRPGVAVITHEAGEVSGCLYAKLSTGPSEGGALLYFNANGRLEEAVAAAEQNGGSVVKPPHSIGPYGRRAIVMDSEGNRIALHSE
ncbi:MAG: VOC family protein [Candidatus Hydrogenedentes bacterium]|nr:VOC family protein [Candidatus Hydrogenedentota bacterium]